jgi:SAM-dependent methyltransferase
MRLFEATGCGALLVTDYKDNLNELFEIGKEVVAYRSPEECAALIKYYLAHPDEAREIAWAGQQRTLREHTYTARMEQTAEILRRHLRYSSEKRTLPSPDLSMVSYGHTPIQPKDVNPRLTAAWQSKAIPLRQRALVQQELQRLYRGEVPPVFQVLADSVKPYVSNGCTVLETGCASGYYYEVLEYLTGKRIRYTGVDYSEPLISMARSYYPAARFEVADGAKLPFKDREFSMVVSGGVLLHVPNYSEHIAESCRVADKILVAHRTPVCRNSPTRYLKKYGYGVEMVELIFNEQEILALFSGNGMELVNSVETASNPHQDEYGVTYVFQKH